MEFNHLFINLYQLKTPIVKILKNFKKIQQLVVKSRQLTNRLMINLQKEGQIDVAVLDKLIKHQEGFEKRLKSRIAIHKELLTRISVRLDRFKHCHDNDENQLIYLQQECNLLLIDHLIRTNNIEAGTLMARELQLEPLIDLDVLTQGLKIYSEIKNNQNLDLLISWCIENDNFLSTQSNDDILHQSIKIDSQEYRKAEENDRKAVNRDKEDEEEEDEEDFDSDLKKLKNEYYMGKYGLMFECQLQRCIELIKDENLELAFDIIGSQLKIGDYIPPVVKKVSSLAWLCKIQYKNNVLAKSSFSDPFDVYGEENIEMNSPAWNLVNSTTQWTGLADLFWIQFKRLYGLPMESPLMILLSVGASALKTHKCKINHTSTIFKDGSSSSYSNLDNECPVCSSTLSKLFDNVPYSLQSKSKVFDHPVLLPNKKIYPLDKLLILSSNMNHSTNKGICSRLRQEEYLIFKNNRGFINPEYAKKVSLDILKMKLGDWVIEDPVSLRRFQINDLEKVYIM